MSDATRATRTTVTIGSIQVDGFMLPDGSYRISLSQAAQMVDLSARNAFDFLRSKAIKSLLGEDYTVSVSLETELVEIESEGDKRGQSRIRALPLEVVSAYWVWQSFKGNKKALGLVIAMVTETLERRFDKAFGVTRTEQEWNDRLTQRIQQLEADLSRLAESYALDDVTRDERDYFKRLLRENGIDPWGSRDRQRD